MKKLEFRNGKFIVDGKDKFLFSAEVHYFRLEPDTWHDRLIKIKEAGFDTVSFYVPWFWHEPESGVFDFSGFSTPRRNLIGFLDIVSNLGLNVIFKPGPYVMSELKNEGLPNWLYDSIPNAIAKTLKGEFHSTRVFSYLHPDYLKYVKRWYSQVADVIKKFENIIMIQIDNEVGMLQWITAHGDYNDDTIARFSSYLSDKGRTELVNELSKWNYEKKFSKALANEYHEFIRSYYSDYLDTLRKYLKEAGIDIPVIVNIHGFDMVEYAKRGKRYPIGVSQLFKAANNENTLLSGDYYIGNIVHENFSDLAIANAIMYAVQNHEQPLFSAEFQSGFQMDKPKLLPSTLELTSRQCMGNGMNGINYYMFVGGDNPEGSALMGTYHDWQASISRDGSIKRSYYVLKDLITEIREIEGELVNSQPVFDTYFGFIPEYYSTEHFREHDLNIPELEFKRDMAIFDGTMRALKLLNYNFGGVNLSDFSYSSNRIESLCVFSYRWMPQKVQQAIVDYIHSGGKVVIFPEIPIEDELGNKCTVLMEALGIKSIEKAGWQTVNAFGVDINAFHVDSYTFNENDEEYQVFARNQKGGICGFFKDIGKGKVAVCGFGVEIEREYKVEVFKRLCETFGIIRTVNVVGEDFLDVYVRRYGNKIFIFANNYDDYEKSARIEVNGRYITDICVMPREGKTFAFELKDEEKVLSELNLKPKSAIVKGEEY